MLFLHQIASLRDKTMQDSRALYFQKWDGGGLNMETEHGVFPFHGPLRSRIGGNIHECEIKDKMLLR